MYSIRGGHSNTSFDCGIFLIGLHFAYTNSGWPRGASLSFKTLFYCDYFAQSSGIHYAIRGGSSANELRCGVFFVYLDYTSGATAWGLGAALSFKQKNKGLDYCPILYLCF